MGRVRPVLSTAVCKGERLKGVQREGSVVGVVFFSYLFLLLSAFRTRTMNEQIRTLNKVLTIEDYGTCCGFLLHAFIFNASISFKQSLLLCHIICFNLIKVLTLRENNF